MPVVSSQYWNGIHGNEPGQADQDAEGLQTMRVLACNMTFLMKSIALGKGEIRSAGKGRMAADTFYPIAGRAYNLKRSARIAKDRDILNFF